MKEKSTAGILALFLGGIGAHKFYLGRGGQGLLYLVFCWTFIPGLIALIESISYFTMSRGDFDRKYNGLMPQANQIINQVHVSASAGGETLTSKLEELNALMDKGLITQVEFNDKRQKLLGQ